MNPRSQVFLLLSSFFLLLSALAIAAVPDTIDYQGCVLGPDGKVLSPVTPANYSMTFRIYNDLSGGTAVWSETQVVTVIDGKFSVRLGEGILDGDSPRPALKSVFTTSPKYLGLTVTVPGQSGTPGEIAPRLAFLSTPFAFASEFAANAATADKATVANQIVQATGDSSLGTATIQKVTVNESLTATGKVSASEFSTVGKVSAGEVSAAEVSSTGNMTAGNLIVTGKVSAGFLAGDGSAITNVQGSQISGPSSIDSGLLKKPLSLSNNYLYMVDNDRRYGISGYLSPNTHGTAIFGASNPIAGSLAVKEIDDQPITPILQWYGGGDGGLFLCNANYTATEGYVKWKYFIRIRKTSDDLAGEVQIGRSDNDNTYFWIKPGDYGRTSDRRLKRDIQSQPSTLASVLSLRPVTFFWKSAQPSPGLQPSYGFIAQEVQPIFPGIVSGGEGSDDYLKINDSSFPSILVRAIQDFHAEAAQDKQSLTEEIGRLRSENATLQSDLEDLKSRLLKLESASK